MAVVLMESERSLLRTERERLGLRPAALANTLRVSRPMIVQLESGAKAPSATMLSRWAEALGFEVIPRGTILRKRGRRRK